MAISSGVDLIEIDRVAKLVERWGGRFLELVYTPEEVAYCGLRAPQLAARFAAKEATMKALGVGLGAVDFRDVEVCSAPSGAPSLRLSGRAAALAGSQGVTALRVSITHTDLMAEAVVAAL